MGTASFLADMMVLGANGIFSARKEPPIMGGEKQPNLLHRLHHGTAWPKANHRLHECSLQQTVEAYTHVRN